MHNLTPEEKKEIYASFLSANYFWVLVSILIGVFSHLSRAIRWKIMMEPMGYNPGIKNTFMAVMIGYFANMALPRLGEVTRCGILARYEKIPIQKSFGTVVTERGIDLIMLSLAFLLTFLIHIDKLALFKTTTIYQNAADKFDHIENPGMIYWIAGAALILTGFLFFRMRHKISHLVIYQKIKEVILGFTEGLKSLVTIKKPFWFIFHSINIWVMYLLMTWIVFFSLPETSHLNLGIGLAVLVFGSIGIIVVQGGIGIYPWIVAEMLAIFAIPDTKGYAMGWLLWTGQTLMIVALGLLSMALLPVLNNKTKRNEFSGIQQ
ncbi:MAG: flippase-like domain-containing protein [Bacteroidales bacterium]|nr:flippase-like domain-containing protein [Bacteroidales bacterium]